MVDQYSHFNSTGHMMQDYLSGLPHSDSYENLSSGPFHHVFENYQTNQDFFSAFSDSSDRIQSTGLMT